MPGDSAQGTGPPSPLLGRAERRPRAPTITIDTTAGDGDNEERDEPAPLPSETNTPILRPSASFDNNQRPISPHNVSSPSSKWTDIQPHNFLAVPKSRSRGNSVDSEDTPHVSTPSIDGETSVSSLPSFTEDRSSTLQGSQPEVLVDDEHALKPEPGNESAFTVEDNKFAFSPGQLGRLTPKSLAAFHALGGLKGLCKGLRTNTEYGISTDEESLDGTVSFSQATAAAKDTLSDESRHKPVRRTSTVMSKKVSESAFQDRKRVFGDNHLPARKAKSIWQLAWIAYNDKVLILLTVAAVISLALGIYQSVRPQDGEAPIEWVEGVAIIVAIVIVVVVGAANDWQKERQFVKLNRKKDDRNVKVIRSGKSRELSVHNLLVGDVMHLEPGDVIPVDGIFISGHNVKCDESSATGESDLLHKFPGHEAYQAIDLRNVTPKLDPFIISGSKVEEGVGTFLVTAVGVNSSHGKTLLSLREDQQTTPLQSKLNVLAETIAKLGLAAGLILFLATFIKFLVSITHSSKALPSGAKGQQFLQVFIVAVTVIVVAVPEGLPLAVTLALAFATTRMLKDNNLVRLLRACETMGNATTICSDKTGTLTQNRMSTVAGTFGNVLRFGEKKQAEVQAGPDDDDQDSQSKDASVTSSKFGTFTQPNECMARLEPTVKELLSQSIALNSTAFETDRADDEPSVFVGSKTETALLAFAREHLDMGPLEDIRSDAKVVQMEPFDSRRKCMAVVLQLDNGRFRLLVKGASEILLARCSRIIRDPLKSVDDANITHEDLAMLTRSIETYASRSLRTIGLLYKDFEQWPPRGTATREDDHKLANFDKVFKDMTFLGVVGLQDPLRDGVADAVRACQKAGVYVRMVTGDNILTAKAIAEECGIFSAGGMIMEGPQFRKLSRKEMQQVIPKLQVLARSSPQDKRVLVKQLKDMGETVAVTGDGTNDARALKTADVGFSMGVSGTEVAKEASDIILMDDNFASIVKAIMWGRAVNDSVKKFLQFQLTVNIVAVILTFVSAVANDDENSVLTAVQLLWVNLIMDTFAALALATDPPSRSILDRPPEPKSAPLVSITMWKMVIGQSLFQLGVTLVLYFAGDNILSYQSEREHRQLPTLIFNVFVFMQIVNQYNCRRIDNKWNILEGVWRNWWFIGIQFIIVGGQVLIVFVGGRAFSTVHLNAAQWAYSIILPLFTIPFGMLFRMIPDERIAQCIPSWFSKKTKPKLMINDEERQFEWNPALEGIREELTFLKRLRGGRMSVLRFKLHNPRDLLLPSSRSSSRRGSRSRSNSMPGTPANEPADSPAGSQVHLPTPESRRSPSMRYRLPRSRSNSAFGPAAAMAGVVAGSIAGWSPIERRDEDGNASGIFGSGIDARAKLNEVDGVEMHPSTSPADPVIVQNPIEARQQAASSAGVLGLAPPSQVPEMTPKGHNQISQQSPKSSPGQQSSSTSGVSSNSNQSSSASQSTNFLKPPTAR